MAEIRYTGTVKWFDGTKAYGFIAPDGRIPGVDRDLFVHLNGVRGKRALQEGQKVSFIVEESRGRKAAGDVAPD